MTDGGGLDRLPCELSTRRGPHSLISVPRHSFGKHAVRGCDPAKASLVAGKLISNAEKGPAAASDSISAWRVGTNTRDPLSRQTPARAPRHTSIRTGGRLSWVGEPASWGDNRPAHWSISRDSVATRLTGPGNTLGILCLLGLTTAPVVGGDPWRHQWIERPHSFRGRHVAFWIRTFGLNRWRPLDGGCAGEAKIKVRKKSSNPTRTGASVWS